MKYIDAELLWKEIEKNKNTINGMFTEGDDSVYDGENDAYNRVLRIINSLQQEQPEQPVEGLEEECERFYRSDEYKMADNLGRGFETIARHFAEWGAKHLKK